VAPLIVLVAVTLIARLAGRLGARSLRDWAGDLVRMVPPAIPNPELMVTFTGVCEILGAIGLLLRPTRRLAAVALIVFLIAVLPANIHAASSSVTLRGAPPTPLVPRVVLQAFFIGLLWWSAVRR
jgi:uncharacterized membrane protein